MKKYIEILLKPLGIASGYIYPYGVNQKIQLLYHWIYSFWISSFFQSVGRYSCIKPMGLLKGGKYIIIGSNSNIAKGGILTAWDTYLNDTFSPKIVIGNNVNIGEFNHITAINEITIGDGVLTGKWITITDNSHGRTDCNSLLLPPSKRSLYSSGPVIIEDNVWIGDKVTILPNVRIGKNAVIGANTVVSKDIPENSIVVGNPMRIIKTLIV